MKAWRWLPFLLTALMLVLVQAAPARSAEAFVPGFEDLPLAPGLEAVPDAGVTFDSPAGRIVESYAAGRMAQEDVLRFYAATLPQLGWTAETPTRYAREGEELTLDLTRKEGVLSVRFSLSPR